MSENELPQPHICTQEERLKRVDADIAQLKSSSQYTEKMIGEVHRALLGNDDWHQKGLLEEFETFKQGVNSKMQKMEKSINSLLETKSRALWLILALGSVLGGIAAFTSKIIHGVKALFAQ